MSTLESDAIIETLEEVGYDNLEYYLTRNFKQHRLDDIMRKKLDKQALKWANDENACDQRR